MGSSANLPPSSGSKHSRHLKEYLVSTSNLERGLTEQGEMTLTKRRPGASLNPLKPMLSDNLFLIYRKNKIYTAVPAPVNRAKLLLRNTVGKFAWAFKHYRAFSLRPSSNSPNSVQYKIEVSDIGQMKKNMITLYGSHSLA